MTTEEKTQEFRLLTPAELAVLTRMFREVRHWSQEQLAELSGLNVRTIQRIEQAMPASLDTRRAIARAFEFEDIDVFSKPFSIPSDGSGWRSGAPAAPAETRQPCSLNSKYCRNAEYSPSGRPSSKNSLNVRSEKSGKLMRRAAEDRLAMDFPLLH